jgi:hypothetical protein
MVPGEVVLAGLLEKVLEEIRSELPLLGELKDAITSRVPSAVALLKGWRSLREKRIGSCVLEVFEGAVHTVCLDTERDIVCIDVECDLTYAHNEENMRFVLLDVLVRRVEPAQRE